jgi:preprotein translocase subunit SecD
MLPRSSSTSSCIQSLNKNLPLTHYESLQNLRQTQRQKCSNPLTIDNNHLNLPIIPHPIKATTTIGEKKSEQQVDKLRRTIVQDDIENLEERLNEMLIAVPSTNENEKHLLTQQKSTNEYFTPKISIEDNEDDNLDRNLFFCFLFPES